MEIEIWSGTTKAIIDPQGAYLTNLSDDLGDIIFPKRIIKNEIGEKKTRGGCHVCLPNFGPGGESGLPQHGFARDMAWEVTDSTDSSVLLTLKNGQEGYDALESVLTYQLSDKGLLVTLEATNNGDMPLRVAPAFHPYFYAQGNEVMINGAPIKKADLVDTVFEQGDEQTVMQGNRLLTLTADNLPLWALWTDELGQYVCIEPTFDGYAFLKKASDGEMLAHDMSKTYQMTLAW